MDSIQQLNDRIEQSDDSPREAAKAARALTEQVAQDLSHEHVNQAEWLSLVHYAALRDVLSAMPTDSLRESFNTWSTSELCDTFGSRELRELLRAVRKIQTWGGSMSKRCTAHMLRTGYCGSQAEEKYDSAEDGVYHPFQESYLRIMRSEDETKAETYDERHRENAWNADSADTDATESTDDTQESESRETSREVTQESHHNDVGAAIMRLVEDQLDSAVDESRVQEIVDRRMEEHEQTPDTILVDTDTGDNISCDREHRMYPAIYALAKLRIPVFMTGEPGTGKSTLGKHVGRDLGVGSRVISLSPDKREYHFSGYRNADGELQWDTPFRELWENGGVCVFDEVATAHPSVLTVLNDAIANDTFEFADGPIEKHEDFILLCADNTGGRGGTDLFPDRNSLDSAFLDRFAHVPVETDWGLVGELNGCEDFAQSEPFEFLDEPAVSTEEWLTYVKQCQQHVKAQRLPHVIGSRAATMGAKMLQANFPLDFVKSAAVWKSTNLRRDVESSIASDL